MTEHLQDCGGAPVQCTVVRTYQKSSREIELVNQRRATAAQTSENSCWGQFDALGEDLLGELGPTFFTEPSPSVLS